MPVVADVSSQATNWVGTLSPLINRQAALRPPLHTASSRHSPCHQRAGNSPRSPVPTLSSKQPALASRPGCRHYIQESHDADSSRPDGVLKPAAPPSCPLAGRHKPQDSLEPVFNCDRNCLSPASPYPQRATETKAGIHEPCNQCPGLHDLVKLISGSDFTH